MRQLFHELVLNGAKFSNNLFLIIDQMNNLYHFNQLKHRGPPVHLLAQSFYLTKTELTNYTFIYSKYNSNFLKCLAFICNYNLNKLFDSEEKCILFLKSCFIKINEIFIQTNNWHIIDECLLLQKSSHSNTSFDFYFNYNLDSIRQFLYDFEQFLKSIRNNGLLKYFPNKNFFNFLRKYHSIYNLIDTHLYSHGSASLLRLTSLTKIKIKSHLIYLDNTIINKLALPKHLLDYLAAGLADNGLTNSFERSKMNKLINFF
jgi:hypothetical protein